MSRRLLGAILLALVPQAATAAVDVAPAVADAIADLRTVEGAALVSAGWRYRDTAIVEVDHRAPGPDLKATGAAVRTRDLGPRPGLPGWDEGWTAIEPTSLETRRTNGRFALGWYRIALTVPSRIGELDPTGSTVVFEIVVDDYAEVWVDGRLAVVPGQSGGALVKGWNAPNRVVLSRDARPGQSFDVAVLAVNAPLSEPPPNYVWVRSATVDFYAPGRWAKAETVPVEVVRLQPEADALLPEPVVLERLAGGFDFLEGPVWVKDGGYLLVSDPNKNVIYRWDPTSGDVSVFRTKSGYAGADAGRYRQPGSNGLALDPEGRLIVAEHGRRRVSRIEKNGLVTVLADRFEGQRLNSPNDVVVRSDGAVFFSDPPFGLPGFHQDPARELDSTGVYCLKDGTLHLVVSDLAGPNGVAFSPDERFFYVGNWDPAKKVVVRYAVGPGCELGPGTVIHDFGHVDAEEAIDGIEVDARGNLWVSAPGGTWVLAPDGRAIATIRGPELAANYAWGPDGTLFLAARSGLYRLETAVGGPGSGGAATAAAPHWVRHDPRLDALVDVAAPVERIVDGQDWLEGPLWDRREGRLLFTDIPRNVVYEWRRDTGKRVVVEKAGYTGEAPFTGREPGANGLAFDREGRLVLCQHGDRRIARLEAGGARTPLAERHDGRRLNSPNDLAFRSDGSLYFTDPPFGLPGVFDDPGKETPWSGVYRLAPDGALTLLTAELSHPNGLAFSPDEKTLYVSNADAEHAWWLAFEVRPDGSLGERRLLHDAGAAAAPGSGNPDGLEVDQGGHLFAAGPWGVWVLDPDGTLLGTLVLGGPTSNVAFGEEGSTLFVTAGHDVYRLPLRTRGVGF